MNKAKKALVTLGLAAVAATSVVAFSGCGAKAAESTGLYVSNNNLSYANFLPNYNYFSATISTQSIETFSDNTYCLTIQTTAFSNISLGPDVATGEETWNDRGQTITYYYGTFTSVEDEGDVTLTLSAPTKTIYITYGTIALDSTQTYAADLTYTDAAGNEVSYNDYIASIQAKFTGASVYVNGAGSTFKQIKL